MRNKIAPEIGKNLSNPFDVAPRRSDLFQFGRRFRIYEEAGFVQYALRTVDGRSLVGMIVDRSAGGVTLRSAAGTETTHSSGSIAELRALDRSLMPADLLDPLSESQIRAESQSPREYAGQGAIDFMEDARLIYCLNNGLPTDMNVYDAVALSAVIELTHNSNAGGSAPLAFPDFTRGRWQMWRWPEDNVFGEMAAEDAARSIHRAIGASR